MRRWRSFRGVRHWGRDDCIRCAQSELSQARYLSKLTAFGGTIRKRFGAVD